MAAPLPSALVLVTPIGHKTLKGYAPIRQLQNKAAHFYVALETDDAFVLEKRLKKLFKNLNPRKQCCGRRNTQQRC